MNGRPNKFFTANSQFNHTQCSIVQVNKHKQDVYERDNNIKIKRSACVDFVKQILQTIWLCALSVLYISIL